VPLYALEEYRRVSYMLLLKEMGAIETTSNKGSNKGSKKGSNKGSNGFVASASLLIRTSIHQFTGSSLNL